MPAIAANDDDNDDHSLSCCIPSPPSRSRPPTPPPAPRRPHPTTARLEPPLRTASPNRQAKMSGIIPPLCEDRSRDDDPGGHHPWTLDVGIGDVGTVATVVLHSCRPVIAPAWLSAWSGRQRGRQCGLQRGHKHHRVNLYCGKMNLIVFSWLFSCGGRPFFESQPKFKSRDEQKMKIKSRNLKMRYKIVCVRRDRHGGGEGGIPPKTV